MGHQWSPLVTLILTLFNVRLGAWLGNPGPAGNDTFYLGYPRLAVRPILAEAFGLTDDCNPYVYLSDGRHFDSLGLYEMVMRRSHYIVAIDAGADPDFTFASLGAAVRKIRIDLGIPIEFGQIKLSPRGATAVKRDGKYCAVGKIHYAKVDGPEVKDGVLIYIKPACYGHEPLDVYEYFKRNAAFPHESTADKFFSESQFESYRMLGVYAMDKICPAPTTDFESFLEGVEKYLASPTLDESGIPD